MIDDPRVRAYCCEVLHLKDRHLLSIRGGASGLKVQTTVGQEYSIPPCSDDYRASPLADVVIRDNKTDPAPPFEAAFQAERDDLVQDLDQFDKTQLKSHARALGLSTSGNMAAIRKRVVDAFDEGQSDGDTEGA